MVPDIVKSSTTKVDQMDDAMLEREIVSPIFCSLYLLSLFLSYWS